MAKKGGGFGRVLELIGLVEEDDPQDIYEDEYSSGNYGRQQGYVPPRQPARAPQNNSMVPRRTYDSARPTARPSRSTNNRNRFDSPTHSAPNRRSPQSQPRQRGYDYTPRSQSRFGSLDDAPADLQRGAPRSSSRPRTVMFTLRNLEDCCDVIDNLIINNTVVLTMDELDVRMMQRAVDTLSGAVFALHATIRKASEHTYLIAPAGVEVNETYDADSRY